MASVSITKTSGEAFARPGKNLSESFENKRLQVNSHLKTLFNVQSIGVGSSLKGTSTHF